MPSQEQERQINWKEEIYNILHDILHRWMLVLCVGIVTAITADLVCSVTYTPIYETGATFVMKMTNYVDDDKEIEEISEAFDYILKSNVFLDKVKEDIGVRELNGQYQSVRVPGTNMIQITATSDRPRVAYMMMYSMMNHYMEVTQKIIGDTQVEVIEKMSAPRTPVNPLSHPKNLILFGAIGAGGMLLYLGFLSYMKDTVKGKNDIAEKLQIRTLGTIAKEPKVYFRRGRLVKKKSILVTQISTGFGFIEGFKKIRSRIERTSKKHGYKVIMVTSTAENEGKTMVTVNLALSLAGNQKKVLVADMDFRKPAVYKVMDMEKVDAVSEVIEGRKTWREAICHDKRTGIDFLLKCEYTENAPMLLESQALKNALDEMRKEYDYILLDSAPISYMSDTIVLSKMADGVIMTIRQNYVPIPLISRAVGKLMLTKTPVIGGVLNQCMKKTTRGLKKSYSHYHYAEEDKDGR